jgi:hypothetical protein
MVDLCLCFCCKNSIEKFESARFTRSISAFNGLSQNLRLPFQRHSDTFFTSRLKPRRICECFRLRPEVAIFMVLVVDEPGSLASVAVASATLIALGLHHAEDWRT